MEDAQDAFIVDLDGFEGPLDLLLDLARAQKVDLARISILGLADQFVAYLRGLRARQLQIAAEYLVMAAWLAYLKSQLLLPPAERELADAEAVAEDLGERLRRLEALRRAAGIVQARPRLGVDRFGRGLPEPAPVTVTPVWRASLGELFSAYGNLMRRGKTVRMTMPARRLVSVDVALERLSRLLTGHDWRELQAFLPEGLLGDALLRRSAVAASLIASLELARQGEIELQQAAPFAPIMVRRRRR
jgi:segregation and condensation protein A